MPKQPKQVEHMTVEERRAAGKAARAALPRERHGEWSPGQRTHDPLELLAEQAQTRVPELVPIRHGRMAVSPFTYYRGAALPMAADLATAAHSGLMVQLCGDAHLSNFGGFASPERAMVFDVNDFDETLPGPFEWDLKRLAASLVVAARDRGFDESTATTIVASGMRSYREAIRAFAVQPHLSTWYARLDVAGVVERWGGDAGKTARRDFERTLAKAQGKDQIKARSKLTRLVDGEPRFLSDPPLLVPVGELYDPSEAERVKNSIHEAIRGYRRSLPGDRRRLVENYRFVDLARKVVGVGSVGTRAWIALLVGSNVDDTLILQVKEAEPSVLERFVGKSTFNNHGQRVVEGQRLMQAASDTFLGWHRATQGEDGLPHDYYVRQLWDWKLSANIDTMGPQLLSSYAEMCGWTLARAHARSGDPIAIGSYLGAGDSFDRALVAFAHAYADQNQLDQTALTDAIAAGQLPAQTGI
jgi:uncharacterized protein (DUF2252 family)